LNDGPSSRLVAAVVLGAMIGISLLGRDALPIGLAIGFGALGWKIFATVQARRRLSSAIEVARLRWASLPGARLDESGVVSVHHGEQPLRIALSERKGELRAHIATATRPSAIAIAIWPSTRDRPPLGPDGAYFGGPPLEAAPSISAAIGSGLHVEAGDEDDAARLLDPDLLHPLQVVANEAPKSFGGLTYDGQRVTVHIAGPMAADPERATWLARQLWEPWV
jgi:hypothetical protein